MLNFIQKNSESEIELLAQLGVNVCDTAEYTDTQLLHLFGFVTDETELEEEEAWDIFPAFNEV